MVVEQPGRSIRPGTAAISVDHVSKWFRPRGMSRLKALHQVSMEVPERSFVSIVGESGCGKSTLFRMIAGLEAIDEGDITVAGSPIQGPGQKIAYMFQDDLLVDWRDVLGNATFGGEIAGIAQADLLDAAERWLTALGLSDFRRARPRQLSGGMRQRVALARTVLTERPLMLLDEPFGALDSITRRRMHDLLLDLWSELDRTILLVTHDVDEAVLLSDRIYVLRGTPGEVVDLIDVGLGRPRHGSVAMSEEYFEIRSRLLASLELGGRPS